MTVLVPQANTLLFCIAPAPVEAVSASLPATKVTVPALTLVTKVVRKLARPQWPEGVDLTEAVLPHIALDPRCVAAGSGDGDGDGTGSGAATAAKRRRRRKKKNNKKKS